jgi:4-hydroxy-4-methyl-2-oxoglutarate aldolase
MGMRFWGPAVTMRVIPTNRRMPVIDRKDALRQHAIWREMGGRTIIPGRVELIDVEVPVGCGGVMVRPGDIVGCDWDGCLVVPLEVAEDVLAISARIAVDDKKSRRKLYDRVGRKPDETVDWEAAAEYFKDLL